MPKNALQGSPAGAMASTCSICKRFRDNVPCDSTVMSTLAELQASKLRGCQVCSMLHDAFLSFPDGKPPAPPDTAVTVTGSAHVWGKGVLTQEPQVGGSESPDEWYLFTPRGSKSLKALPERRLISNDPLSDGCCDLVLSWIAQCEAEHDICRTGSASTPPKRLIDVGGEDSELVKLVTGEAGRQYAALTHCWGNANPLQTVRSNQESLRSRIVCSDLPRSFRDAVRVTRRLGIRYLWIDSLCIVQDDPLEWEEEASRMPAIFGGCYLLIAASFASSCDGGFLQHRDESSLPRHVGNYTYQEANLSVYVDKYFGHVLGSTADWHLQYSTLLERAWCFQELQLAPRTLHFATKELVYQCRVGRQCECGSAWKTALLSNFRFLRGVEDLPGDARTSPRFGERWQSLVSEYSAMKLTYDRDQLPALSGIASLMLTYSPGRYLAGIWERDLPFQLGWQSVPDDRDYRPSEYVAPSFSWTSRIAGTRYVDMTGLSRLCTVVDAQCAPSGLDPFGRVKDGYVTLRGPIIKGRVPARSQHDWDRFHFKGKADGIVLFDTAGDKTAVRGEEVYCFRLWHAPPGSYHTEESPVALVLQPSTTPGAFKRVGIARRFSMTCFDDAQEEDITVV